LARSWRTRADRPVGWVSNELVENVRGGVELSTNTLRTLLQFKS
jgi:hypothetical protein